jgi:hypothetical protein
MSKKLKVATDAAASEDPTIAEIALTAAERWLFVSGVSQLPVKGRDQAAVRAELMHALLGDWDLAQREKDGVSMGDLEKEEVDPLRIKQAKIRPLLELLDLILDDGRLTVRQSTYFLSAREKIQDARK